jgi:hypothetical protein
MSTVYQSNLFNFRLDQSIISILFTFPLKELHLCTMVLYSTN